MALVVDGTEVEQGAYVDALLKPVIAYNHRGPLFIQPAHVAGKYIGTTPDQGLVILDNGPEGMAYFQPDDVIGLRVASAS